MKALLLSFALLAIISSSYAVRVSYGFDQPICLIRPESRHPREMIAVPDCRENYEQSEDYCARICDPGYSRMSPAACFTTCPAGWKIDRNYDLCVNPGDKSKLPHYEYNSQCEKVHGKCKGLPDGYGSLPYCSGTTNMEIAKGCQRYADLTPHEKITKWTVACEKGLEKIDGLCYPSCPPGSQRVGNSCQGQCPAGYIQCGAVCSKGKSCDNIDSKNIEAFVAGVEQLAEKTMIKNDLTSLLCA